MRVLGADIAALSFSLEPARGESGGSSWLGSRVCSSC